MDAPNTQMIENAVGWGCGCLLLAFIGVLALGIAIGHWI